jgi:hypothetical protein
VVIVSGSRLRSSSQMFDATIEFKDADGFVVDDDSQYKLVVPANSEQTFVGYDLVNASFAGKIHFNISQGQVAGVRSSTEDAC